VNKEREPGNSITTMSSVDQVGPSASEQDDQRKDMDMSSSTTSNVNNAQPGEPKLNETLLRLSKQLGSILDQVQYNEMYGVELTPPTDG